MWVSLRQPSRWYGSAVVAQVSVFAILVFLVTNSIGSPSFAGAAGFEVMLLFIAALTAERLRAAETRTW